MELETVAQLLAAWYRLVGTESGDPALIEHGEAENEVAYQALTRGVRSGQRFMLSKGYAGWRVISSALSFTQEAVTGIWKADVPDDFLRAYGNKQMSALLGSDGKRWGQEVEPRDYEGRSFQCYWMQGEQIRIPPPATPPTLYLDYHYRHPAIAADTTLDFPLEARSLIVAEGADQAKRDNWLPGGKEMETKIREALVQARENAIDVARPTKQPRQIRTRRAIGTHW